MSDIDMDKFLNNIKECSGRVNSWPDWKKEACGVPIKSDFEDWWKKNWGKNIQNNSSLKNACRYAFTDAQIPLEKLKVEIEGLRKEKEELKTLCNTKDATIEYLEGFIQFCQGCGFPEGGCLCN